MLSLSRFRAITQVLSPDSARHYGSTAVAAAIGVVISVAGMEGMRYRETRLAQMEFRTRASNHALILQNGINDYLDNLVALRAFFHASNDVSRANFQGFSDEIVRGRTGILAFSWIPRIARETRLTHEAAAANEGLPDYHIHNAGKDGEQRCGD